MRLLVIKNYFGYPSSIITIGLPFVLVQSDHIPILMWTTPFTKTNYILDKQNTPVLFL